MHDLARAMFPEILLTVVAGVLFLLGVLPRSGYRRAIPVLAVAALLAAGFSQLSGETINSGVADRWHTVQIFEFARYIKLITAAVGVLLLLLAWPTNAKATGGLGLEVGLDVGEFFGLMLLSIVGVFIVAGADDFMLLFLGIELASLPTYIMVSISRPLPLAQEAGVKYFFLGAMAAALLLLGLTYLYGTTGTTKLSALTGIITPGVLTAWQKLALVLIIGGLAFKMAAVPMHVYAADVYQGAATPVTAFLSFVPKISGFVALLRVLYGISGGTWHLPHDIVKLICIMALLTMTVGNVLGLLQFNIKRLLAYSSIAHSGYMLVGVAALVATTSLDAQAKALPAILFYLLIYGVMNIGAFGCLMMLPARLPQTATRAETFEDIAGMGRRYPGLALLLATSIFSLIGLPLTVGLFGKVLLIRAAWDGDSHWLIGLVIAMVINSAISAAYYLKIVASLFLRTEPTSAYVESLPPTAEFPVPVLAAVVISVTAVLGMGMVWPVTQRMIDRTNEAAQMWIALPSGHAAK